MKSEFAIINTRRVGEELVVEIDTAKARYNDMKWHDLGTLGKRKFENLVFLANPTERLIFIYR